MNSVYQGSFVRLVSGDLAPDDIGTPDPKGVQTCTLRIVVDEDGKIVEVRAGQLGNIEGVPSSK